jgi:putative ABC transport system permease protein
MKHFDLALKMLWRDFRAGELSLLLLALLIAISCSSTVALFADRLHRTMNSQAAEFLAADLAISSPEPLLDEYLNQAAQLGLAQSQTTEFSSVLMENQEMLLASVKAVSQAYPLRGYLKTSQSDEFEKIITRQGPETGEAWVEPRILSELNIKLGDNLTIGEKTLLVKRLLNYEPDKRSNFFNYSPRVMMNQADMAATKVIQPGSRVHYTFQFSGDESRVLAFKDSIKPKLSPAQRIMDIHEDRPEMGSALSRAEQYLGLSSIVVVLISGVAIAMTSQRYSERHFNTAAILRCLGCKQKDIIRLFSYQFLLLGFASSLLGCLLGWLGQYGIFYLLKPLLPEHPAQPGTLAVLFGFCTGLAVLLGFALPPLLRLQAVSPARVLRRDLEPLPAKAWLVYGLSFAIVAALIWRYTADTMLTLNILGFGLLTMAGLGLLIYSGLRLANRFLRHLSLKWRFGMQGLLRNSRTSVSQILAFGVTLTAMTLSFIVGNDLLDNWQRQLPEHAANYFVLNISPDQQQAFQTDLQALQIAFNQFYPVTRGRLLAVNNSPVQQRIGKDNQAQEAIQRELSLTTATMLPEDNKIIDGEHWQADKTGLVSIEQKLAENLDIHIGDQLTFSVGSQTLNVTVANKRSVQWDTMRPNFYMILSPGSLDSFPKTYLTSFYLAKAEKPLLNRIHKSYPAVTILEVDLILQQFKTILTQLTQAVNLMLYFAVLAGLMVLYAAVQASLDQRKHETAIMRTLGARISLLRSIHLIEFMLLGGMAGILAVIASEALSYVMYTRIMHIDYQASPYLWIVLPILSSLTISIAGYFGVRNIVKLPPITVLRRLE